MNNYVLNHNYGYGNNEKNINKLYLRDINDLNEYIKDVLENQLDFEFTQNENEFIIKTINSCIKIEKNN